MAFLHRPYAFKLSALRKLAQITAVFKHKNDTWYKKERNKSKNAAGGHCSAEQNEHFVHWYNHALMDTSLWLWMEWRHHSITVNSSQLIMPALWRSAAPWGTHHTQSNSLKLHKVPKLELPKGVHSCRHVCAQLYVLGQHFQLAFRRRKKKIFISKRIMRQKSQSTRPITAKRNLLHIT